MTGSEGDATRGITRHIRLWPLRAAGHGCPHDEAVKPDSGWVIPDELLPCWRDLPALAWLARQRLSGTVGSLPVLGLVARLSGWLLTLVDLVGMRADHAVGSHRDAAVVTVQQRWPSRVRW